VFTQFKNEVAGQYEIRDAPLDINAVQTLEFAQYAFLLNCRVQSLPIVEWFELH